MSCRMKQGSVLVPALFLLYVVDVIKLAEDCRVMSHAYADNLQIYCKLVIISIFCKFGSNMEMSWTPNF